MDNKQAATVLQLLANPMRLSGDQYGMRVHEAAERGADAIEMLEWLFTPGRWAAIYSRYLKCDVPGNFRAFAEQQWRASRGTIT